MSIYCLMSWKYLLAFLSNLCTNPKLWSRMKHLSFTPTYIRRCSSSKRYVHICNRCFHKSYINPTMSIVHELPMEIPIPWEFSRNLKLFLECSKCPFTHAPTSSNLPELHEIHETALMNWMISQVIDCLNHSACSNLQVRIQWEYALLPSWKWAQSVQMDSGVSISYPYFYTVFWV